MSCISRRNEKDREFFKLENVSDGSSDCRIKCVTWNVHSLTNKVDEVMEHILDKKADIVFLTETWQKTSHSAVTATIKKYGYTPYHQIRVHDDKSRGGGIGILCSNQYEIKIKKLKLPKPQSFEYCVYSLAVQETNGKKCTILLVPVYRDQYVAMDTFINEFDQLLQSLVVMNAYLVISGDFNIWWGSSSDDAVRFRDLLDSFDLSQHVTMPTNSFNHILDLVVTSKYAQSSKVPFKPSISDVTVNDVSLSDHYLVYFQVDFIKCVKKKNKTIYHRHYKSIDKDAFREELSILISEQLNEFKDAPFHTRSVLFNNSLADLLDEHAPLKKKVIKDVPGSSWFNLEYILLRRQRRKAEKVAAKSGLSVHRDIFVQLRKETTLLAKSLKKADFSNSLLSANGDQKKLFSAFNKLVDESHGAQLPDYKSEEELANRFSKFFIEKVTGIRDSFGVHESSSQLVADSFIGNVLSDFKPITIDDMKSLILEHGVKCSIADVFPADIIKDNLDLFLPVWTNLVNASLKEGTVDGLKLLLLILLLKIVTWTLKF